MTFKIPCPPNTLHILQSLQPRMHFSTTQLKHYHNLQKGYEGEKQLNRLFNDRLSADYLILTDLLLENNQTEFQIDTLLIGHETIYPLEIKNYEGNFYIQNDNWYIHASDKEIRNPLHQLKRSELLLKNVLPYTRFNFSIEPYLIFTNPSFFLYQAPVNLPAIFPTQINRFIQQLNSTSFTKTQKHTNLVSYLNDHRLANSTHAKLPNYSYTDLKKGIVCNHCQQFVSLLGYTSIVCPNCGTEEKLDKAVNRSVVEFATLFPEAKITTRTIQEWCDIVPSTKTIRRILMKHMILSARGRHAHYIFKN